ncbi:MAG: family 10 glycosylhydrolase [Paludibacteraceae bacterium]|nr:family 10 glycosylhydrolase [Paludibacteraceae bacterium]
MKKFIVLILLLVCFVTCFSQKRQMRAAWIATVNNIDWPSQMGLSTEEQQKEMVEMLDQFQKLKFNAIFVQIRPTSDGFYFSELEPWSKFLTGTQGKRPEPFYDPLKFIIDEAHKRCLEVHAWLNPYRVSMDVQKESLHASNLFFKKPYLFVEYGGKYYFNPGLEETRVHLNNVVREIVRNYDVDAIHFDDYFYPYRVANKEFPDEKTFIDNSRGFSDKNDWRRDNVNLIIKELQQTIKSEKPWVEFGISPFGVWRNNDKDVRGSATKAGMTNYDDLYADILKWLEDGDIDYVVPQLYWEIGKRVADYKVLVGWWNKNNFNRNLYIGLFASGLGQNKSSAWNEGNELVRQMNLNGSYENVQGVAFYSAVPLLKNPLGILDSLRTDLFRYCALVPHKKQLENKDKPLAPQNLQIIKGKNKSVLLWEKSKGVGEQKVNTYVVYAFKGDKLGDTDDEKNIIGITYNDYFEVEGASNFSGKYTFGVSCINRFKIESEVSVISRTF